MDLYKEEHVAEGVARLIAQPAAARGSSLPDCRQKPVSQPPRMSAKSDRSTGSDIKRGSLLKPKLKSPSCAEALMISLISTTLQEIGKQDVEAPTKADKIMLLPLAQKISKVFDRCETETVQTELIEGLGNTYGFDMATNESLDSYLVRMLYHIKVLG